MYPPMEMDNGTYYPKPMNCPMHCLIYASRQRSYRELPLRLFELGTVYRYERAGTLHGLMRIRGFTQDDSHIYCTEEQLAGRDRLAARLRHERADAPSASPSSRPTCRPRTPTSTSAATRSGTRPPRPCARRSTPADSPYEIKEGDAAFYGPKIDIDVRDAIGRTWQLSTIQCDFNHPERFGLEYVGADNARHRPIMLHRALFGSIERFFAILVEHYAGALPTWLSPEQVRVLGVRDDHQDYADEVAAELRAAASGSRSTRPTSRSGARIRRAKLMKLPYILVVGDDDVAAGTVGVNRRGSERPERGVPRGRVHRRRSLAEIDDALAARRAGRRVTARAGCPGAGGRRREPRAAVGRLAVGLRDRCRRPGAHGAGDRPGRRGRPGRVRVLPDRGQRPAVGRHRRAVGRVRTVWSCSTPTPTPAGT